MALTYSAINVSVYSARMPAWNFIVIIPENQEELFSSFDFIQLVSQKEPKLRVFTFDFACPLRACAHAKVQSGERNLMWGGGGPFEELAMS